MDRKQLEEILVKKAAENSDFKAQLLRDPKAAIEKATGQSFPAKLEIKAVEETPSKIYIRIPSDELSDDDLDSASGGSWCFNCTLFC